MADWLNNPLSHGRQAPVEGEPLPEICNPMPDANSGVLSETCDELQESQEAGTRGCASSRPARWQRGGQRNQRRKRATILAPKSAQVVHGQRHHRLRTLVDQLMCRDGRSEESLLERRAVRTLAGRQNHQNAFGKFLNFVQRTLPLVEGVDIDGALIVYSTAPFREFSITMVHSCLLQ